MSLELSVIIVNYNVKFFLEQCLHSVYKGMKGIEGEVFVVDNNSVDGSMAMVRQKFPETIRIENKKNTGFSKANNQAIKKANGRLILLLNPDTVVEEDTFSKVIKFMNEHPEAGALGVKMIDGKGHFLPESKRALPTPWVSFYKVFGLSWLFPKSKRFGKYHLGYLDKDETHEIEILPGAFMLLRKEALDKAGLLDETFFMYGEDIDLSYRILKAGYKNYYYPETAIIHYKGESTRKSSINYVLVFYQAMIIFANKHFSEKNAKFFSFSIHAAIYFRMGLAIVRRFMEKALYPMADAIISLIGFILLNSIWEKIKFEGEGQHPPELLRFLVPLYILVWLLSIFFSGGYDRPYSIKKLIKGLLSGSVIILAIFALLPNTYRFSRLLILVPSIWNLLFFCLLRFTMNKTRLPAFRMKTKNMKRVTIVGAKKEFERIKSLLTQIGEKVQVIGRVEPVRSNKTPGPDELGKIEALAEIVEVNRIDEIIFSGEDMSTGEIIKNMLALKGTQTDYKISPPDSHSIIGSNSINTAGELYVIDINSIAKPSNKRNKRLFDFITSLILIIILPIGIKPFMEEPLQYVSDLFKVLFGSKTWIGYFPNDDIDEQALPNLRPAVLQPVLKEDHFDSIRMHELNLIYAKNYSIWIDLRVMIRYLRGIL